MTDPDQARCASGISRLTEAGDTLVFWEDGNLTKVLRHLPQDNLRDVAGTVVLYGKVCETSYVGLRTRGRVVILERNSNSNFHVPRAYS